MAIKKPFGLAVLVTRINRLLPFPVLPEKPQEKLTETVTESNESGSTLEILLNGSSAVFVR